MNYEAQGELSKIRNERGYDYMDIITVSPEKLPNYEQKVSLLAKAHTLAVVTSLESAVAYMCTLYLML